MSTVEYTPAQLFEAVGTGDFPAGVNAKHLADVKFKNGSTLLHVAAAAGNLPPDTTVTDLAREKDNNGKSALDEISQSCIPGVLNGGRVQDHEELKEICTKLQERNRFGPAIMVNDNKGAITIWVACELRRLIRG
jgi:hypothetical protein